jgi:lipid-A-disaccharide synthase
MEHTVLHSPDFKSSSISLMIVAGEASGDKHGASLAQALTRLNPEITFELFGSGGEEMRAAGVETLVDAREVGIIGVPEIARAIGKLYRAYRTLLAAARSRRPSGIVLIDWPDFNMRLARKLHREGFKIIYYISPQVWAWRKYRVRALRRDVDRMLVILPFEEEFYKQAGVEVEYVGHPLAGIVGATATREEFCSRHGLDPTRPIVSLLPGSREKEIHYHLPVMLDAAVRLRTLGLRIGDCGLRIAGPRTSNIKGSESSSSSGQGSDTQSQISNLKSSNPQSEIGNPQSDNPQSAIRNPQFVIPLASTVSIEEVESVINHFESKRSHREHLVARIIERDTHDTLAHSDFAIIASGTATVEAALSGTPMVIIYRGSEINWRLLRPLIHLSTFGMVNLIAGSRIVPELIQHDATAENIATEVSAIMSDSSRLAHMKKDLARVRDLLSAGGGSAAERAATAVMNIIATG